MRPPRVRINRFHIHSSSLSRQPGPESIAPILLIQAIQYTHLNADNIHTKFKLMGLVNARFNHMVL